MRVGYHVEGNDTWVEVVKVKEVHEDYFIADMAFYSKSSGDFVIFEENMKVRTEVFASWDIWGFFDSQITLS